MTEHVSNGIISNKHTRVCGRRAAAVAVAALLALPAGCARRGSPVAGDGDGGPSGYRLVATLAIEGYAEDVEVAGGLALIAASQGGLVVVDVSDPRNPLYLGMGPTGYSATGCAYAPLDSLGYVTSGSLGAFVYDLSDPTAPAEVTNCQGSNTREIVVVEAVPGELHYIFGADGVSDLRVWTLTYSPVYETWFPQMVKQKSTPGNARDICLEGDFVFLAMEEVGLTIFDVSAPGNPEEIGHVDTPGEARAVAVDGNYAYVADWRRGLQVVDVSSPGAPEIVGTAETEGNANGIYCSDGKAYVADHVGGLRVFDVSDPTSPAEAGYFATPYANAVFATDGYVFVADRDWGLVVLEEDDSE